MVKIGEHGWWNLLDFGGSSFSDKAITSDRCWLAVAILGVCRSIKQMILLYESSFLGFGWAVVDHDSPNFNSCFWDLPYTPFSDTVVLQPLKFEGIPLGFFDSRGTVPKNGGPHKMSILLTRGLSKISKWWLDGFPNMAFLMEVSVYCIYPKFRAIKMENLRGLKWIGAALFLKKPRSPMIPGWWFFDHLEKYWSVGMIIPYIMEK